MTKIPFNEEELRVIKELPGPFNSKISVYNTPVTAKENMRLFYQEKSPYWIPSPMETAMFMPAVLPDNVTRALVMSFDDYDPDTMAGGPDMYGTIWQYEPGIRGSIVRPGNPRIEDMNDWEKIITRPDIDSWDWEGSARINNGYCKEDSWNGFTILTGWFERLISLMDFAEAAVALIDDEQKDAVKSFFEATTEDICKIIDKAVEYFPQLDFITIHDDWAGQKSPFFSEDVVMEMIVPYMKKTVDHIHSKGLTADLHCCGRAESRINAMIAAGWDSWCPQDMNDIPALYEKYGDKIIFTLTPDVPEDSTDEEKCQIARDFVEKYTKPGKPVFIGIMGFDFTPAMREELYRCSRKHYAEQ